MAGKTFYDMVDNIAMNMSQLTNSYIFTGASIANPSRGTGPSSNNRFTGNSDVYYDFLKDYHFVSSILDIFTSNIIETLEKCDFRVEIKGESDSPISNEINQFIELSELKEYIKTHAPDFVYRGQYSFLIDFDKNEITDVEKPYSVDIIKDGGEISGYLYGNKFIPSKMMATYYYKPSVSVPIKEKDILKTLDDTSNDTNAKVKKVDKNSLESIKVKYAKFKGESLFKRQLSRLFQMFVTEYELFYLGLRDTLRPELIGMSTGGRAVNLAQSLNMANNVESLLNQSTQGMANIVDPMAFMNSLTYQILNYVKVVPSVEQYSNINDISFGDLSQKREKLKMEREQIQKDILNNIGVPEELFIGNANRWEVMARNDRFMTVNDTIIKSITRLVKDIALSYAKCKGIPLSYRDIQFNIDFTTMLTSYDVKSKVEICADRFNNISNILQSVSSIYQFNMVNKKNMHKYLIDQLSGIDEKLAKVFPEELPEYAGDTDNNIIQTEMASAQMGITPPSKRVDDDGQLLPEYIQQQEQQQMMQQQGDGDPESQQEDGAPEDADDQMAQESQGYEG